MKNSPPVALAVAMLTLLYSACAERPSWTILDGPTAATITEQCSRPQPSGLDATWDASPSEVAHAEKKIDQLLTLMLDRAPAEYRKQAPTSYVRQYVGFLRNGQRVLYLNGQAESEVKGRDNGDAWRDQPVTLCDGGLLGFGAVFDLTADRFDWFSFDGTYAGLIPMNYEL